MILDPLINRAASTLWNYEEAYSYLLDSRKLTKEEIVEFRLGYTAIPSLPPTNDPEEERFMEDTRKLYALEKKILIPLENPVGKVNGVITRSLEKNAKFRYRHFYLDESKKIGAFFGLRQALPHIISSKIVYVTEGAFDSIAISRHFPNTLSTLTSFINEEQMYVLRMLADTIVLVFDPDEPGRKGVDIVFNKYGRKGIYSREFGNTDANSYLVKYGDEALADRLNKTLGSISSF